MSFAAATQRWFAHGTLALLLLGSQVLALAHGQSHAVQVMNASAPGDVSQGHCDDCDALIAFEAMLPAHIGVAQQRAVFAHEPPVAPMPTAPRAAALPVYRSRAPPVLG